MLPLETGTYGNRTGLKSQDECQPCDGGKYCGTAQGKTEPDGECLVFHFVPKLISKLQVITINRDIGVIGCTVLRSLGAD